MIYQDSTLNAPKNPMAIIKIALILADALHTATFISIGV